MIDELKRHIKNAFKGAWMHNHSLKCTLCWKNLKPSVWACVFVLGVILGLFL